MKGDLILPIFLGGPEFSILSVLLILSTVEEVVLTLLKGSLGLLLLRSLFRNVEGNINLPTVFNFIRFMVGVNAEVGVVSVSGLLACRKGEALTISGLMAKRESVRSASGFPNSLASPDSAFFKTMGDSVNSGKGHSVGVGVTLALLRLVLLRGVLAM